MTDLQRFIEMYKSFGIELKPKPTYKTSDGSMTIEMEQGSHPKFGGYRGFSSTVDFDKDGKFIQQEFWE